MDAIKQMNNKPKSNIFIFGRLACQRWLEPLWQELEKQGFHADYVSAIMPPTWLGRWAWLALKKRQDIACLAIIGPGPASVWAGPAKSLGLPVFRIFLPDEATDNKAFKNETKILAKHNVLFLPMTHTQAVRLREYGLEESRIKLWRLGVPIKNQARQENIFSCLAAQEQAHGYKKFFTIGAWADLNGRERVELLMKAVEKCRSVVANLQLIVIGDGAEKKNLAWLAKKMGIGDLVWFVGEPAVPGKWLGNLDSYVAAGSNGTLEDVAHALKAALAGRPLILPETMAFDSLFAPEREALYFRPDDSESLAAAVIRLRQDKRLAGNLAAAGKARAEHEYTVERMAEEFLRIINT